MCGTLLERQPKEKQLLREIARGTGRHFQGLRSAAAHLRREGLITNKLTKKLARIDDARALNRHVTVISAASVVEELGLCIQPKYLPTAASPNCNSGNQKEWHHAADMKPREESAGNHVFAHPNGNLFGNFDHTLYDKFHNIVHR